jgi:translation initiation factor 2D
MLPSFSASFNVQDLMKRSSHKKLSKFLSSAEKEGLLRLKQIQKPSPDTLILSLNTSHDAVRAHADSASSRGYRVVGEEEEKRERRERAGKERETASEKAIDVLELWKPHAKEVITLFKAFNVPPLPGAPKNGAASEPSPKVDISSSAGPAPIPAATISSPPSPTEIKKSREQQRYFTSSELKTLLDQYISSHSLVHPRDRKYVILDATLKSVFASPQKPKGRDGHGRERDGTAAAADAGDTYFTREELLTKLKAAMQPWYEIRKGGKEGIRKYVFLPPAGCRSATALGHAS